MSVIARAAVFGLGKAGCALVRSLRAAGREIVAVGTRSPDRRADTAAALGLAPAATLADFAAAARGADVVFLAVSDAAIASLAAELAPLLEEDALIAHLAGARGREILDVERAAAFHPLASLSEDAPIPAGAACGLDAAPGDLGALEALALDLGLVPVRVTDRVAYHLGASIVANLSVALLAEGADLLVEAGLDERTARVSLARLLASTAANAEARELPRALTGPVPRGDADTVRAHLGRLAGDARAAAVYRALSARLVELAELTDAQRAALEDALDEG